MLWLLLLLTALLSTLPNLHRYPFKNEESLRHAVAFEMWHRGDLLQPTLFGELYYNKPPLFNWFILLSAQLFEWGELAGRVVSLTFLNLTALLTGLFSYRLFRSLELSLLSSLIFVTFGNVLFFYGYLAEIDMTFTFFVFLSVFFLHAWWERGGWLTAVVSGLVFGLSTLLKGLPSYAFMGLSLLALATYRRRFTPLLRKEAFSIYFLSLLVPLLWLVFTPEPLVYSSYLWKETFGRVGGDFSRLEHMLTYPLLNLKDLLPWSFLFFGALYTLRRELQLPPPVSYTHL
ncbi:MAG: glycosyltransferase family 39 protein, partial [Aquificaceae bacterium]|nr:glycosyltransferase family 39 protein [Aquificaceae bacterium]